MLFMLVFNLLFFSPKIRLDWSGQDGMGKREDFFVSSSSLETDALSAKRRLI